MLTISLTPNRGSWHPLYRQLYAGLARQIRTGEIPAGSRLPGKRTLAAELGICVNTVDTAYQMLASEGYIESRPRSGFVVLTFSDVLPHAAGDSALDTVTPSSADAANCRAAARPVAAPAFCTESSLRASLPSPARFDLSTTGVDTALFPFRTWGRLQKELLYSAPELLSHGDGCGDANLRVALAEYLAAYRGVRCAPEQIVVGAGLEYLLGLLAPLLKGICAVEDPGYPATRKALENSGLACRAIAVDAEGISVSTLAESDATLCYVTPSHQFPTGVTMPAPRRAALLAWAQKAPERYILEDDYDSEFRFEQRPLPSLQGMAGPAGRVIYLSTVSKSLAPSIRIAYLVLPQALLGPWHARYGGYASTVSRFEQQTFCRFLSEGYFTRHLARMRNTCRGRRDALVAALNAAFGPAHIRLFGLHTGLHLLLTLPDGPGERAMVAAAAAEGIHLTGLSSYYTKANACPPNTVVIGYGTLSASLASEVAASLYNAFTAASEASSNS